jgi:hypothetical protein
MAFTALIAADDGATTLRATILGSDKASGSVNETAGRVRPFCVTADWLSAASDSVGAARAILINDSGEAAVVVFARVT